MTHENLIGVRIWSVWQVVQKGIPNLLGQRETNLTTGLAGDNEAGVWPIHIVEPQTDDIAGAQSEASESVQPQVDAKAADRAAEKRAKITADAVAAVNETKKALKLLDEEKTDEALAAQTFDPEGASPDLTALLLAEIDALQRLSRNLESGLTDMGLTRAVISSVAAAAAVTIMTILRLPVSSSQARLTWSRTSSMSISGSWSTGSGTGTTPTLGSMVQNG